MLELYGFPISNFYNKVKLALLEKEIEFKEVRIQPSPTDPKLLEMAATGRIPFLKHKDKFIIESTVLLEYLEDAFPEQTPLLAVDPLERAHMRIIASIVDLQIDPPARKLYQLLNNKEIKQQVIDEALPELKFGLQSLARLTNFSPFIAGDTFSIADCSALATLPLIDEIYANLKLDSELSILKGYQTYLAQMQLRPSVKKMQRGEKAARRGLKMSKP